VAVISQPPKSENIIEPFDEDEFIKTELEKLGLSDVTPEQIKFLVESAVIDVPGDEFQKEYAFTDIGVIPKTGFLSDTLEEVSRVHKATLDTQEIFKNTPQIPVREDIKNLFGYFGEEEEPNPIELGLSQVFPSRDYSEVVKYYFPTEDVTPELQETRIEEFFEEVSKAQRTPEVETMLKTAFPDITISDIDQIYGYEVETELSKEEIEERYKTQLAQLEEEYGVNEFEIGQLTPEYLTENAEEMAEFAERRQEIVEQYEHDLYSKDPDWWRSLEAGTGSLLSAIGGVLDWAGIDGIAKTLKDSGKEWQQIAPPIKDVEFTWQNVFTGDFWRSVGLNFMEALPTTIALLPLGLAGYGAGTGFATALGLGGKTILKGIFGAAAGGVTSGLTEAAFEAGSVFNQAVDSGLSESEASEAANKTFQNNALLLIGTNAAELFVGLRPVNPTRALSSTIRRGLVTVGKAGTVALTEGGQEVLQEVISKSALGQKIEWDDDMKMVALIGSLMGIGMGTGFDIISNVVDTTVYNLPAEQKANYENVKSKITAPEDIAKLKALDEIADDKTVQKTAEAVAQITRINEFEKVVKPKTEPEKLAWKQTFEKQRQQVKEKTGIEIKEVISKEPKLSNELRDLHNHPARVEGFRNVTKEQVNDYLNRLKTFAIEEAPNEVPRINIAIREANEGDIGTAGVEADTALTNIHKRYKISHPDFELKITPEVEIKTVKVSGSKVKGFSIGAAKYNLTFGDVKPIERISKQSYEVVKQNRQGALTKVLKSVPGLKQLMEFERPGLKMTGENEKVLAAHVASTAARADVATKTAMSRLSTLKELSNAFGKESLNGGKVDIIFIGTEEQSQNPITKTLKDIADNPQLYELNQEQKNALANLEARNYALLNYVVDGYGAEIGKWMAKPDGAYLPNVDISEDAVEMTGSEMRSIASGRAKTRVWASARDRMANDKSFEPELSILKLLGGLDSFKSSAAAGNTFRYVLGGKTRVEVIEETHPELFKKWTALKKELNSLLGSAGTIESNIHKAINDFLKSPVEDADLATLRDELDVKLKSGPRVSFDVEAVQEEIARVRESIKELRPMWEAANTKPYVFVQQGLFRYYTAEQANLIKEILKTTNNPILNLMENIRGTAFSGDLSPIIGVQTPLGALFDPTGSLMGFIGAVRKSIQEGDILRSFRLSSLENDIASDPDTWSEFFSMIGRPPSGAPREFAGGFLHYIPGFSSFNESTFIMVTRQQFNMWKKLSNSLIKSGVSELTAKVAAAEKVTEVFPLVSPEKLGQSQARQAALRAIPTSYSFIRQPAQMMSDTVNAVGKLIVRKELSPKEKLSLRLTLTMAGTTMAISVLSAAIDAKRRNDDVLKAVLDAINPDPKNGKFCSIILGDNLRIPIGGPYRALFRALYPQEVTGIPVPVPFAGIGQYIINRLNPVIGAQVDLLRNKDYYYNEIMTGDTQIERVLRGLEYELESILPLTIGTIIEDIRTGAPEDIIRDALSQFAGFNLIEYGKVDDTNELINELGILKPNLKEDSLSLETEEYYTTKDLWSSLKTELKYVKPEDLTAKNGYSDLVILWAETQDIYNQVSVLSDTPLYKINANPLSGDTFIEYYQQYQEVQRINSDANLLERFKKEHDGKTPEQVYPNYNLGNMTQSDYSLLVQYHDLQSDEDKSDFLAKHSELTLDSKDEWLKSHPEENAKLGLFGQVDLLTTSAYTKAQSLITELGIPENALVGIPPEDISGDFFGWVGLKEQGVSPSSSEGQFYRVTHTDFDEWAQSEYGWQPADEEVKNKYATKEVGKLIEKYDTLRESDGTADAKARKQFRIDNPILDAYFVNVKGYTPVSNISKYKPSNYLEWYRLHPEDSAKFVSEAKEETTTESKLTSGVNIFK